MCTPCLQPLLRGWQKSWILWCPNRKTIDTMEGTCIVGRGDPSHKGSSFKSMCRTCFSRRPMATSVTIVIGPLTTSPPRCCGARNPNARNVPGSAFVVHDITKPWQRRVFHDGGMMVPTASCAELLLAKTANPGSP